MYYSPGILSSKVGQPVTNCKRVFLNGIRSRNISSITYQKSPKIRVGDVDKKQAFLEPYTEQHGNEAACSACCVAQLQRQVQQIERIYCVFFPGKSIYVLI